MKNLYKKSILLLESAKMIHEKDKENKANIEFAAFHAQKSLEFLIKSILRNYSYEGDMLGTIDLSRLIQLFIFFVPIENKELIGDLVIMSKVLCYHNFQDDTNLDVEIGNKILNDTYSLIDKLKAEFNLS